MKRVYTDVAIIGAGSAGLVAFRTARKWTSNVVMIEGGPYGTNCARVGCMPSKLLIAAAEAAHAVEQANEFGIRVEEFSIDGAAVMDRVRSERDRFVGFVVDGVESIPPILNGLGVEVLVFGRGGPLGPLTDPKVAAAAKESLGRDFYLDTDANVSRVTGIDDAVRIEYEGLDGQQHTVDVDYVIAATGRSPNVKGLALENTSLPLDDQGVPVFDPATMRIGDSHAFIAGDVDSENFVIGEVSFKEQGRSRVMLKNDGLLRVYASERSGRFLGAEMFGPRAEHIGHLLAWAHQSGMTIAQMLDMPYYHPVIEEGLRTALRDAEQKLRQRINEAA